MIEAIKFWNEPNNLSHWDFLMGPDWVELSQMTRLAAQVVGERCHDVRRVLGGISPIDVGFIQKLAGHGVFDDIDVVAMHGFPWDWNHWQNNEWPDKIAEIEGASGRPVWVTEVGASSFGAEEVQL